MTASWKSDIKRPPPGSPGLRQALAQQQKKSVTSNVDGSQSFEMCRTDLAVKQLKIPAIKLPGQLAHRYFRAILLATEHRFTEKDPTESNSIYAADQLAMLPDFYRVTEAAVK